MESIHNKDFHYPPGGILIWIIVFLELITFGIALIVFSVEFNQDQELFLNSQNLLNKRVGLLNTIILITSGYFMAATIVKIKNGQIKSAGHYLLLAILGGISFLVLKGSEYIDKIAHGYTLEYDGFFNYYWLLTGFHFVHVLVGVIILFALWVKLKQGHYNAQNFSDLEAGGVFWHMVDLIWILLFPVLYLLH